MKLHGYFRSSASFRVRIGLALKGLAYENAFVHLRKGEQAQPAFLGLNPQGLVPALADGPQVLTQSLAILEYLEETRPQPPFLPAAPTDRARVRAIAQAIACDIHPLNNLRVLLYLGKPLGQPPAAREEWQRHWIAEGFAAIEILLGDQRTGRFCHGDAPGLADICLVPQVFNARRPGVDTPLTPYPRLMKIYEACMALPAFADADPAKQPDAEP